MTERSVKSKVDEALEVERQLHECAAHLNSAHVVLGQLLHTVKTDKLWRFRDCDKFETYIADPELALPSRSTVYTLIKIYQTFVLNFGVTTARLASVGWTKLKAILKVVTPDDYDEWLTRAEALSRSDLLKEVRLALGKDESEPRASTLWPDEAIPGYSDGREEPTFLLFRRDGRLVVGCVTCETEGVFELPPSLEKALELSATSESETP